MLGKRKSKRPTENLFGIGLDPILGLLLAFFTFALVLMLLIRVGDVPPLRLHTETLPDAVQWKPYAGGFAVSGGIGPYEYKITDGRLPPGVSFQPKTGLLQGVPREDALSQSTQSKQWDFTLAVKDADGHEEKKTYSLTVCPVAVPFDPDETPLSIARNTSTFPTAFVGEPYETVVGSLGGIEPYRCFVTGLPTGLVADANGRIHGKPIAPGQHTVQVQLRDQEGVYDELSQDGDSIEATATYRLSVIELNELKTYPLLPREARKGRRFVGRVAVYGGQGPYRFRLVEGKLPDGLRMGARSGFIVGEPESVTSEEIEAVVGVQDIHGDTARTKLTFHVLPEMPSFAVSVPARWADARQGKPYALALGHVGGTPPIQWRVNGLPDGLHCDHGNQVLGRLDCDPGKYQVSLTATDAAGNSTKKQCVVVVRPALQKLQVVD